MARLDEGNEVYFAGKSPGVTTKATRTRALRYKRPALRSMGWDTMHAEIAEIAEACEDVRWADEDALLAALDDDEEALWEFRMAFTDLCDKATTLSDALYEAGMTEQTYNDCTVALVGNRYRVVGFDSNEEDYMAMTSYEQGLAQTEAGKRLARLTKPEMLATIGQCVGIFVAYLDLRQSYDYLRATLDILRDESAAMLDVIRQIEAAYEAAEAEGFDGWARESKRYAALVAQLPDRIWIE